LGALPPNPFYFYLVDLDFIRNSLRKINTS